MCHSMNGHTGALVCAILEMVYVDKNVWHEQQPDGGEKWFAVHPKTHEEVEIDPEQAYFRTEEWQAGEREVDEEIAAGRVKTFATMEDFLTDLQQ